MLHMAISTIGIYNNSWREATELVTLNVSTVKQGQTGQIYYILLMYKNYFIVMLHLWMWYFPQTRIKGMMIKKYCLITNKYCAVLFSIKVWICLRTEHVQLHVQKEDAMGNIFWVTSLKVSILLLTLHGPGWREMAQQKATGQIIGY